MSTPTLPDLLAEVRKDIAAAEARVAQLRGIEEYLTSKLSASTVAGADGPFARLSTTHPGTGHPRDRTNGTTRAAAPSVIAPGTNQSDAAAIALAKLGGRAHVNAILNKMSELGYKNPNPGTDPKVLKSSVYSAMARSPERFERVGRGTWRLRSESEELDQDEDADLFGGGAEDEAD